MTSDPTIGVVLSGGGANGAYEVGVLKALLHGASPATAYQTIDPGTYTGTSVGAYNAAMMSSRPGRPAATVVEELEALWLDRLASSLAQCGNGVYRVRGAPFQFLAPGCLVRPVQSLIDFGEDLVVLSGFGLLKGAEFLASDAPMQSRLASLIDLDALVSESPLKKLLEETLDLDGLRRSGQRLTVAASNWLMGSLQLYSKAQIADQVGTAGILASTALPGIFPAVLIDGVPYVDGGVLLNTPLKPAIADGADILHVIFLDPLVQNIPLPRLPSSLDTFYRMFAIIWAANVRTDLVTAAAVNAALGAASPGSNVPATTPLARAARQVARGAGSGRVYRPITIHIYRPATPLGGGDGLLDFSRDRLAELIALGYRDAASHDCQAAGCVLPGAPVAAAPGWRMAGSG